jgi:hypothetical protein
MPENNDNNQLVQTSSNLPAAAPQPPDVEVLPIENSEFKDFFLQTKEMIMSDHEEVLETFRELKDQSFNSPNLEVSHETRAQLGQLANVLSNLDDKMVKVLDIAADFVRPKKVAVSRASANPRGPSQGSGTTTNNIIIAPQSRHDMLDKMEEIIIQQQAQQMATSAGPIIMNGGPDPEQQENTDETTQDQPPGGK